MSEDRREVKVGLKEKKRKMLSVNKIWMKQLEDLFLGGKSCPL